jgi:hypothetical protein
MVQSTPPCVYNVCVPMASSGFRLLMVKVLCWIQGTARLLWPLILLVWT